MDLRINVPHGARIWNYWLGGKDNYEADRAIGDAVLEFFPTMPDYAKKSRQFLVRAVRFLAGEAGITQFLDIGTGLPSMQNTHEVAQEVNPAARIVYVDNDPLVLAHARALLRNTTAEGRTTYIDADYSNPQAIIAQAREELDLDRPTAVMFMGVFGYLDDPEDVRKVIADLMAAVPSGSYMALWDSTDTSAEIRAGAKAQADLGSPYALRTVEQIRRWFDGLDMVEPGLVQLPRWRPTLDGGTSAHYDGYGAVAVKP
jgi:hypothetical protein